MAAASVAPAAASTWLTTRALPNDLGEIHIVSSGLLECDTPGNGGLRVWNYADKAAATKEAEGLAVAMSAKHKTYNTGFAGAKVVCAADKPVADWTAADRETLLEATASLLEELDGAMYTGCDMNTTPAMMQKLHERCGGRYVLAALANETCCPNTATAAGVLGAVTACVDGDVRGKTFVVHGCGGVGGAVAAGLVELGAASVKTVDLNQKRAAIPGCEVLDPEAKWWAVDCDALVPCSASGVLTAERASELICRSVVGASNLPFASVEARRVAEARCVVAPEGVTSAGAVIVDSIEHYAADKFREAPPSKVYDFTFEAVRAKTDELLAAAVAGGVSPTVAIPLVEEADPRRIGERYSSWLATDARDRVGGFLQEHVAAARPAAPAATGARRPPQKMTGRRSFSTTSARTCDTLVVGGGVMGLNIAYQLKRRDPAHEVTVLEAAPALGAGSSGYSTGFQRAYYSFDETMGFALDGINAHKNWQDYLADTSAVARFVETGALWMLGYDEAQNAAMVERLAKFGVGADVLDEAAMGERFPLINCDPMPKFDAEGNEVDQGLGAFSAVYEHGCGHMDSSTCLEDLHRACVRDGVDFRFKTKVAKFTLDGGRCTGAQLADGSRIEAATTVNAAGPWCGPGVGSLSSWRGRRDGVDAIVWDAVRSRRFNALNETVGVKNSTTSLPTRIQVGHKYIPDEYCSLPFVADGWGDSGIYFMPRAGNNQLVFGSVAHRFESEIVDPDDYNDALDPDVKQDYLNCLFHRLPGLETSGEIVGFSSMYTVNQDDVHPVIGESNVPGLWACNGFSGHGFKLAPAVGSLVAQQITGLKTDAWETSVAHDFMGPGREPLTLKVKTHFA